MFSKCSVDKTPPRPDETTPAPQEFRDALAELVQMGLRVARMVGQVADAETAVAETAAQVDVAAGVTGMARQCGRLPAGLGRATAAAPAGWVRPAPRGRVRLSLGEPGPRVWPGQARP